ncbi:MAG TPA: GNAT family N-acetyltransferase [Roseiflexaceae bacterium]|nr:GNAT family N-acetyltransferase [Roseiflexaceae bacterium]
MTNQAAFSLLTPRLRLRDFVEADWPAVHAYVSDPRVVEFLRASAHVMEKLGMRREGHLVQNYYTKKRWWDSVVYAILAEEWRAQQAALG